MVLEASEIAMAWEGLAEVASGEREDKGKVVHADSAREQAWMEAGSTSVEELGEAAGKEEAAGARAVAGGSRAMVGEPTARRCDRQ